MKDILIIIGLGIICMFIALLALQAKETGNPIKLIVVCLVVFIPLFFLIKNAAKCPKCQASSADVESTRNYTSNASLDTRREYSTKGGSERNTYWVRNYEDHFKCKKCNHTWVEKGEEKKES